MKKKILIGVVGALVIIVIGVVITAVAGNHNTATTTNPTTPTATAAPVTQPAAPPTTTPPPPASPPPAPPSTPAPSTPALTGSEQQAVNSAENYLADGQGFSEQGLLQQLTSQYGSGFSTSDAQFAINYLNPNWDQQAVEAAKNYLNDGQGFSQSSLLQQLTSSYGSGFTYAQAEYALSQVGM
jgi:hypothetical protein